MATLENSILQEYKESLPRQQILSQSDKIKVKILFSLLPLLNWLFPKGNVQRFGKSIKFYLGLIYINNDDFNPQQKPKLFLYLGLTSKPWYESDDYDVFKIVTNTLEEGAKDIKSELLMNISHKKEFTPMYDPSDIPIYDSSDIKLPPSYKKNDWVKFLLWEDGNFTQKARYLFPKTVNILSKLGSFINPFEQGYFLVLKPGISLPPHHDATNIDVTCHLGLIIPENCGIRVGSET